MINKKLSGDGREVFLFGANHSKELNQINEIESSINPFNPEIVLIEGGFDKANFNSKEEAIKLGQEMGFTSFLCKEKGISMKSNDPSDSEEIKFLEENYKTEVVNLYFLLRDFSTKRTTKLPQNIDSLMKEVLNEKFHLSKDYGDYFNPTLSINLFNEVTRKLDFFRDSYLRDLLKGLLKKHKRIFIIKGDYHLESDLDKLQNLVQNG